eukprot:SAG31_NODE_747_length_12395_cov_129.196405_5_plen_51_part_00
MVPSSFRSGRSCIVGSEPSTYLASTAGLLLPAGRGGGAAPSQLPGLRLRV